MPVRASRWPRRDDSGSDGSPPGATGLSPPLSQNRFGTPPFALRPPRRPDRRRRAIYPRLCDRPGGRDAIAPTALIPRDPRWSSEGREPAGQGGGNRDKMGDPDPNWAYDGACSGPNYGVSAVTLGTFFSDPYREITYVNVSGVTASHYFYIKIEGGTNGLDVLEVLTSSSQIYNGDSVTTDHDEYMYVPVMYIHYENSRIDLRKSLDLRDFVHAGYAFAFGGSDVHGSDIIAGYGARIGGTSAGSLVDGETVIDGGLITSLT